MSVVTEDAPTPHRGRPRSVEADRAILETTRTILIRDGYAGLTMAGVATEAGVSSATLYRRFQCRDDLVVAALAEQDADSPIPDSGDLAADLAILIANAVRRFRGDKGQLILSLVAESNRNPALVESLRARLSTQRRSDIRAVFTRAIERGQIDPSIPTDLAVDLFAGPLFYRLAVTGEPVNDRVGRELGELVLRAVGYKPPI